ncbi:replication initiation negative regulator SeqA [Vibrio scophthalmi]|uniref:Negative modulator of initiation of replication n=2 Tax=Vibrio scophthalmi TaxID=45658 RepID=A0A1B1NR14_9VIBR|nr:MULTISPECIES: replication initiation negative regulator SeqA [Vibrio]ANS86136.1 Negative modulator of initiation of replication [Vibrio scophthalmi]ANU35732.1 Negative modulator of initiation of replication [Vibrio scophthalmi]EGU30405.1 replication initiation regulator SeqA [Vibrio scophthalmi LMG 19158]EGU37194.1 replication initiation regulator SeqA [Vibrio sp. N418]MCY9804335.1 replication initiation negative regulator SeqA [Vibrio scophthalmi]
MKTIEVDEDLYRYIAGQTQHIGESASDILRRLLNVDGQVQAAQQQPIIEPIGLVVSKDAVKEVQLDGVKEMRSLLISDEFAGLKKAIDRFMLVLSTLHRIDPESFSEATQVKGRKRVYFADNEQTLLANGNTTKPKAIPASPFWVITNNNTSRKRQMVDQLMSRMSFPADLIEKVTLSI